MIYRQKQKRKRIIKPWMVFFLGVAVLVYGLLTYGPTVFSLFSSVDDDDLLGVNSSDQSITQIKRKEIGKQNNRLRSAIFDRNMEVLAESFRLVSVYLRPLELRDKEKVVGQLAELLDLENTMLLEKLRTERSFVWLKRNLSQETAEEVAALKYSGVYLVDEMQRYYPYHHSGSHVIGFVKEEQGLAGIEFTYDNILRGQASFDTKNTHLKDIWGQQEPEKGAAVVLSLDINLQIFLEQKLQNLLEESTASAGLAVVMDIESGAIVAMANNPSYDPNIFWKYNNFERKNRSIVDPIPIGGLGMYFRGAAEFAVGNRPVGFFIEKEAEKVIRPLKKKLIRGAKGTRRQNWNEADSTIVSPEMQWQNNFTLDSDALKKNCIELGLHGSSGVDLPDFISYGQAGADENSCHYLDPLFKTTALNLLTSFAQIINGGRKVTPHLVQAYWKSQNELVAPHYENTADKNNNNADFVTYLEKLQPPSFDDGFFIQSMMMEQDPGIEVTLGPPNEELIGEPEIGTVVETNKKFNALILGGYTRHSAAKLAIIIAVDDAKINLLQRSLLKTIANEVLKKGVRLSAVGAKQHHEMPTGSHEDYYEKWSHVHESRNTLPVFSKSVSKGIMPALKGMSLRKALQTLQEYNLSIAIKGAGRVINQFPQAGTSVVEGNSVILELMLDN